jgi:hypothetical protein
LYYYAYNIALALDSITYYNSQTLTSTGDDNLPKLFGQKFFGLASYQLKVNRINHFPLGQSYILRNVYALISRAI